MPWWWHALHAARDVEQEAHALRRRQPPALLAAQELPQRAAVCELHHDEQLALVRGAAGASRDA